MMNGPYCLEGRIARKPKGVKHTQSRKRQCGGWRRGSVEAQRILEGVKIRWNYNGLTGMSEEGWAYMEENKKMVRCVIIMASFIRKSYPFYPQISCPSHKNCQINVCASRLFSPRATHKHAHTHRNLSLFFFI